MLTPNDIRNATRISGYDHVGYNPSGSSTSKPYQADVYGGKNDTAGRQWKGPRRASADEAAQDYCDYVNGKPLTIEDIRNPARKSGFNHVKGKRPDGNYHAQMGQTRALPKGWHGPRRATAEEAAQDYCDFVNSKRGATPAIPQAVKLKSAGHQTRVRRIHRDPEELAALGTLRDARAQRAGVQGYVYLIVEDIPGGALEYGKIGYSTNPPKRAAELQTGNPRPLRLLLSKPGTEADEAALHQKYIRQNVLQEWFLITKELLLEWDAEHLVV